MQCVRVFVEFYAFNHFLKYTYAHSRTILACLALVERRCTNATRFQKDIRQTDEHTYTSNGRGRGSSNGRIFIWTRHAVVVSHPFTHSIVSSYRRRRIELVQAILIYIFCFYSELLTHSPFIVQHWVLFISAFCNFYFFCTFFRLK